MPSTRTTTNTQTDQFGHKTVTVTEEITDDNGTRHVNVRITRDGVEQHSGGTTNDPPQEIQSLGNSGPDTSRHEGQRQHLDQLLGPVITDQANKEGNLNWAMQASSYDDMKRCAEWATNLIRNSVGVPNLVWDEGLANDAKAWAQQNASIDRMEHSSNASRPGQGENLYKGTEWSSYGFSGPSQSNGSTSNGNAFLAAVLAWTIDPEGNEDRLSEKERFDRQTGGMDGHYTQSVWKSTTKFGLGVALYGDRHPDFGYKVIVCGRYNPPGNYVGQRPY